MEHSSIGSSGETVSAAITSRHSNRRFAPRPVDTGVVRDLVRLACAAPAPHHSRPWRFVAIESRIARERLTDAMADAWRADLQQTGRSVHDIQKLLMRSRGQIMDAPALLLACLSLENARHWPDQKRRAAERDMFVQSLGAALQNILLAAGERGLAGYLKGAPLFCADAVRRALDLPAAWQPAFLVLLGYPALGPPPPERSPLAFDDLLTER